MTSSGHAHLDRQHYGVSDGFAENLFAENLWELSGAKCTGQGNGFKLIPTVTSAQQ